MKRIPLPSVLRYPLLTRMGRYEPRVAPGVRVRAGDVLARGRWTPAAGCLHAGTSGVVEHEEAAMLLYPDGHEEAAPPLTAKNLVERVRQAGIVGMGGAGYPTWLKLEQAKTGDARTLIVNAVECEPGVSSDAALLRDHADAVLSGIEALAGYLGHTRTVIALGEGMDVPHGRLPVSGVEVVRVAGAYPSGSERSLVAQVLGIDLGRGLPTDVGVVVFNVATVFAVSRAWHFGERLVERVVTVDDVNAWVRIGHPVEELPLSDGQVIVGGPVTGWVASEDESIAKTTRAVTVREPPMASPCIRCGWCATACPEGLLPQEMFRRINSGRWSEVEALRLDDCVECGACDLACPSRLPLLATFRYGKSERREAERRTGDAALARDRYAARVARLERQREVERNEREARIASRREWR